MTISYFPCESLFYFYFEMSKLLRSATGEIGEPLGDSTTGVAIGRVQHLVYSSCSWLFCGAGEFFVRGDFTTIPLFYDPVKRSFLVCI